MAPSYANLFTFNSDHYVQIPDTVKGARMALSYANLFTFNSDHYVQIHDSRGSPHGSLICQPVHRKLERDFLQTQSSQTLGWLRYIDDIFVVWTHGEPALQGLLGSLNRYHTTIRFTSTCPRRQSHFWASSPTCRTNALRQTCSSSLRTHINASTSPVAIPDTARLPFLSAKLLDSAGYALNSRTLQRVLKM